MDTAYTASRSPGSFGSLRNLQRYSGRSEHEVKIYMVFQAAYMLHKLRRIRFPRRKTFSKGIRDLFQIVVVDVSSRISERIYLKLESR